MNHEQLIIRNGELSAMLAAEKRESAQLRVEASGAADVNYWKMRAKAYQAALESVGADSLPILTGSQVGPLEAAHQAVEVSRLANRKTRRQAAALRRQLGIVYRDIAAMLPPDYRR